MREILITYAFNAQGSNDDLYQRMRLHHSASVATLEAAGLQILRHVRRAPERSARRNINATKLLAFEQPFGLPGPRRGWGEETNGVRAARLGRGVTTYSLGPGVTARVSRYDNRVNLREVVVRGALLLGEPL